MVHLQRRKWPSKRKKNSGTLPFSQLKVEPKETVRILDDQCTEYATYEQRLTKARELRLFFRRLGKHQAKECTNKKCHHCKMKHNSSLSKRVPRKEGLNPAKEVNSSILGESEEATRNVTAVNPGNNRRRIVLLLCKAVSVVNPRSQGNCIPRCRISTFVHCQTASGTTETRRRSREASNRRFSRCEPKNFKQQLYQKN